MVAWSTANTTRNGDLSSLGGLSTCENASSQFRDRYAGRKTYREIAQCLSRNLSRIRDRRSGTRRNFESVTRVDQGKNREVRAILKFDEIITTIAFVSYGRKRRLDTSRQTRVTIPVPGNKSTNESCSHKPRH